MSVRGILALLLTLAAYVICFLGLAKDAFKRLDEIDLPILGSAIATQEAAAGMSKGVVPAQREQILIQSRAFEKKTPDRFPCFLAPKRWWAVPKDPSELPTEGFFFVKTHKTGSSTCAGIHLRIARNMAARKFGSATEGEGRPGPMCQSQFHHAPARAMKYSGRSKEGSFLWTVVREPTQRAISDFFHFGVTGRSLEPTAKALKQYLVENRKVTEDYYLKMLQVPEDRRNTKKSVWTKKRLDTIPAAATMARIQAVINDYDFIGITERMDESIVALQMILGLPTADVLFLSAKSNGGYDAGGWNNTCLRIHPKNLTPDMEAFLQSPLWESYVKWDRLLYDAANQSLDKTIHTLGREEFEKKLAQFREAQDIVNRRCLGRVRFPCSRERDGLPPLRGGQSDCLWGDSACGMACLDKVSDKLGLWNMVG
ncbi:expressed unknown protein [Seminavis robusta]|uniref:Uncharacterized protein n=1 Tax=Seminavis robusta TaxID=568900 RepID=A0A9N8DN13_9STRA|nr:expressed unknown protein [Seminavis robusta]|eukprot:Sro170_g075400.1 n/a (427) ;mRNA; f:43780-45060